MTRQEKQNFIDQLIDEVKREVNLGNDFNYFLDGISDYLYIDNFEDVKSKEQFFDKVEDVIDEFINWQEIIYHYDALDFLKFNDLNFAIAIEEVENIGFDVKELHPSLLATLVLQAILRDEVFDIVYRLRRGASK